MAAPECRWLQIEDSSDPFAQFELHYTYTLAVPAAQMLIVLTLALFTFAWSRCPCNPNRVGMQRAQTFKGDVSGGSKNSSTGGKGKKKQTTKEKYATLKAKRDSGAGAAASATHTRSSSRASGSGAGKTLKSPVEGGAAAGVELATISENKAGLEEKDDLKDGPVELEGGEGGEENDMLLDVSETDASFTSSEEDRKVNLSFPTSWLIAADDDPFIIEPSRREPLLRAVGGCSRRYWRACMPRA